MNYNMKKMTFLSTVAAAAMACSGCTGAKAQPEISADGNNALEDSISTVYFIKEITPESLVKIYNALGRKAEGDNVAVKLSTGESSKSNHIDPNLIAPLVKEVNGTIVECNTAYAGNRNSTEKHLEAAREHGFTSIAKVDIMDADGEVKIPVDGGEHLKYDIVGKNFLNYDFLVVLSHFKGHAMGGYGGALKNISIGIASSNGKAYIHTAGKVENADELWNNLPEQDAFLESMADACKGVIDHMGDDKMLYISVANKLSVDCDCNGDPETPKMGDIGILASLDPVALDRACVDMVFNSDDPGKGDLIERINSRHGTHTIDQAEKLGLGSQKYRVVTIE